VIDGRALNRISCILKLTWDLYLNLGGGGVPVGASAVAVASVVVGHPHRDTLITFHFPVRSSKTGEDERSAES
jgi:hypothetical protein